MAIMDADEKARKSASARERGNQLYKKGRLEEAEAAYKEAASLAPGDVAPISNLSAVKFEKGQYPEAAKLLRDALALSAADPDESPKKQKLYARLAKCHLHSLQLEGVKDVISKITHQASRESLAADIDEMEFLKGLAPDETVLRKDVFDRLPRYKPCIQDEPEYFAVGHDNADSLYTKELEQATSAADDLAFLLCGSGDGRHFFATLVKLCTAGLTTKTKAFGRVHFTLVDLKPAALARNLLMLDLLARFAIMKKMKTPGHEDVLVVMAYLYTCQLVPPLIHEKLQEAIASLLPTLEEEREVFKWLYIPSTTRAQVCRCLRQWQQPMGERYQPAAIRGIVRRGLEAAKQARAAHVGQPMELETPKELAADRKVFDDLTVLLPSDDFIERREPQIKNALEAYRSEGEGDGVGDGDGGVEKMNEYINANWKTNVTLLDMDFEAQRDEEDEDLPSFHFDPVEQAQKAYGRQEKGSGDSGALANTGKFFDLVGLAVAQFANCLKVEFIAGEMADVLERMRYDGLEHRTTAEAAAFPKAYDRIHLSNVPDYVGGLLTTFQYARPLLREDRPSNLQFDVLLNPAEFESHDDFEAEYLLMADERRIGDHFCAARRRQMDHLPASMAAMFKPMRRPLLHEGRQTWERAAPAPTATPAPAPARPLPRARLLPRPALERWLHALLLKLHLPHPRPQASPAPVHAPLNATALLRLVAHLHARGYPAHWLSGVLAGGPPRGSGSGSGSGSGARLPACTARAPRALVTGRAAAEQVHAARDAGVAPWRAEWTTLLAAWRGLLPFGVALSPPAGGAGGAAATAASLRDVCEYAVGFPAFAGGRQQQQLRCPHFALVFWDVEMGPPPRQLRRVLVDDETGDEGAEADRRRDGGVHVVSTFSFATETRTATFWLRRDVVEAMMAGGEWKVFIWRTDTWERLTEGVDVRSGVVKTRAWIEE